MHDFNCRLVVAGLVLMAVSATVNAKIPPLSKEQKEKGAALIIEGVVLSTKTVGEVTHDNCYGWQRYDARVIVKKVWKGGPTPKIITVTYSTKVKDENKCVGGRDSYYLGEGERYKMYLASSGKGDAYYFFNWTCLERAPRKRSAMANPKKLARAALRAYRKKDLSAYNRLLTDPFSEVPSQTVFDNAGLLKKTDRVRALFYLDDQKKHIAAIIRKKSAKSPALWFRIEKVKDGYSVVTLVKSDEDPPSYMLVKGF